jgi:hypothetical protein
MKGRGPSEVVADALSIVQPSRTSVTPAAKGIVSVMTMSLAARRLATSTVRAIDACEYVGDCRFLDKSESLDEPLPVDAVLDEVVRYRQQQLRMRVSPQATGRSVIGRREPSGRAQVTGEAVIGASCARRVERPWCKRPSHTALTGGTIHTHTHT